MREFKIYPRIGRRLHFLVQVFDTKWAMWAYCQANCMAPISRQTKAVCHSFCRIDFRKNKKARINPEMGNIHFYQRGLETDVVAHECTHAAIFWLRRIIRKDLLEIGRASRLAGRASKFVDGPEELLCLATGNLLRQCNLNLHRLGIWK
jgi:hypothetical protein